jgi:microcystin-dependent protein
VLVSAIASVGTAPGDLKPYFGDLGLAAGIIEAEPGFLLCNGTVLEQLAYPRLHAAIGTKYNSGGELAGQFRLPDFRDRFIHPTGNNTARPPGSKQGGVGHKHTAAHTHTQSHIHGIGGHIHDLAGHYHDGTTDTVSGQTIYTGEPWRAFIADHNHYVPTGGPEHNSGPPEQNSGDTNVGLTDNPIRTSDFGSPVETDANDPPYQVVGGIQIRYA